METNTNFPMLGQILPCENGPDLSRQNWIDLIDRNPNLTRPSPVERPNPFTGKSILVKPNPDFCLVVVDGRRMGSIYWFMDGDNGIWVDGESDRVVAIANQIAEALGGRFVSEATGND